MLRLRLYRSIICFLAVSLIFDFFFIAVEVSKGQGITSALTLFDKAIIDKTPIECYVYNVYNVETAPPFILFFLNLLSPILILILLYRSIKYVRCNMRQPILLFIVAIIGTIIHLIFVVMFCRFHGETSSIFSITDGYFGAFIGIIKHIAICYFTYQIRFKSKKNYEISNVSLSRIFFLFLLTQLIFMFFCTPINNRISYEGYKGLYGYEKYDYSKFMFAPFYMIFKYKNYGSFPGKVEFYPYMIIMLLCYIGSFVLEFFKNKITNIITIVLLVGSVIVLTIGCIDLTDSFMARYMTHKTPNFINCVNATFFFFIIFTGALIFLRVMQIIDIKIIKETENLVNADEYVKEHSNDEEETNEDSNLENNEQEEPNDELELDDAL